MYAVFGVATFGLEVGEEFDEDCDLFEDEIIPLNLPALLYAAKVSIESNPNKSAHASFALIICCL